MPSVFVSVGLRDSDSPSSHSLLMPICASLAASISARTLSMTLRGMNAVASHWWLSVFMAVWI